MFSLFYDVAVPHDQDEIGFPDCGEPVGYDEGCYTFHHLGEGVLDFQLGSGIDGGCSLIQYEHRRQAKHDSRDAEQLFLPL